ncbi:hypothetical protein BRD00_03485 [Halobacteriales archaeon QS_8_69_26]|nr:MAG: hypothetical protein BRD00_03485 [Halobacteriales archaeon QS_8_69_26]
MVNALALALAVLAAVLILVALLAMTAGEVLIAGLCFFSASLVIFLRETRALPDEDGTSE